MEDKEYRRKSKRHDICWKAAVVFDNADGRPILHTQTENLSIGGAAIGSNYGDLTGSSVTLLLGLPVQQAEIGKTLKISARVVSTTHTPPKSGYRHGLRFEQLSGNSLDILKQILDATEPGRSPVATVTLEKPATTPAGSSGSRRLADLKQKVLAKQMEKAEPDSKTQNETKVSLAIERAYRYLKEFTDQLNSLKPKYAKGYTIAGVPAFDDLIWGGGRVDFATRETSPTTKRYERINLNFRLSAGKEVRVTRETPADEKLKTLLRDTRIEFTTKEERNDRGFVVRTAFVIPCEVRASLELIGNFDTGKLLLKTRNIERFGMMTHVLDPGAITDESLDELAGFILGETMSIGPLILKNA